MSLILHLASRFDSLDQGGCWDSIRSGSLHPLRSFSSGVHDLLLFMIRERGILSNTMKAKQAGSQIIAAALTQLKAVHPVQVANLRHRTEGGNGFRWDGELTLKTRHDSFSYVFEVKTNLRPQTIKHLLVEADLDRNQWGKTKKLLILADYVNPHLAHQLKEAGVNFIDTAGNLFLKWEPKLYLYVEGKKPPSFPTEKPTRLFQASGLTMLLGLLLGPESVNHPYRQLAELNGIALGTVGWVMRDLRQNGYLEPVGKDRVRLVRRNELLERWVQGYAHRLRPKALAGQFNALSKDLDAALEAFQGYAQEREIRWGLTGGFGADELLHHYRGQALTIFVETWPPASQVALEWIPVEGGPITILKQFSPRVFTKMQQPGHYPVVHPMLVYAELLYRGSDREVETARMIYKEFLESSLGKD